MTRGNSRIFNDNQIGKYFWQTANIVDDLDISPMAFRLYARLVRISGLHAVDVSTRALAEACHMSTGSISNAKVELIETRLISIVKKPSGRGEDYDEIHILDIAARNIQHCEALFVSSPHERISSPHERKSSPHERISSPHEHLVITEQKQEQEKSKGGRGATRPPIPVVEVPPALRNQPATNNKRPGWMGPVEPDARITAWRAFTTNAPLNKVQEDAILSQVTDCDLWTAILKKAMLYHSRANVAKFLGYYAAGDVPVFNDSPPPTKPARRTAPPPPPATTLTAAEESALIAAQTEKVRRTLELRYGAGAAA